MPEKKKIRVGFPGDEREIEVLVPDGDEAPWDLDTRLRVAGTDIERVDGPAKVTGRAKYAYDYFAPGLCHAVVLRSPHAAAIVKAIDLGPAERAKGVVAAIGVPAGTRLHHQGEEVAAVAAETEEIARAALGKIAVTYEPLPFVVDKDDARKPGAPLVFAEQDGNVSEGRGAGRQPEKVDEALAASHAVVNAVYRTQVQTHSCLETHGCAALWEGEGTEERLTIWASTQATGAWKSTFARRFGLGDRVRVLTPYMGGGFGSKFGPRLFELWCVELARKSRRPVKLMADRRGEHLANGNRPDSVQEFTGGVTEDGRITAMRISTYGTGGIAGGARCANPAFYDIPVFAKTEADVFTNAGPGCAMRAPGWPQGVFALDSFVDELSAAIGMDPLEFRRKNDPDPVRRAQYDIAAEEIGWSRRQPDGAGKGPIVRGFGIGNTQWFQAGGGTWEVVTKIRRDGTVEIQNGAQDIGTGTRTVLAIAAAEELGLPVSAISVGLGDTSFPDGPGSGGSQTAASLFPAARNSAARAGRALLAAVADALGVPADGLGFADGRVLGLPGEKSLSFAEACALLPESGISESGRRQPNYDGYKNTVAGTQFAEVEVDRETGVVRVVKIVAVQDCGQVIDKLTAESQVKGAVIGGLSYALFEDRILDKNLGRMVNPDLLCYKIAGALDMPEIVPIMFHVANGKNNAGMMGLGEPPAVPTAAAIANAVANATGARVREIPITPARVLAALASKGGGR